MDDFREESALRQTVAEMGNAAAEWIKQSAEERALLLRRIEMLERIICGLKSCPTVRLTTDEWREVDRIAMRHHQERRATDIGAR